MKILDVSSLESGMESIAKSINEKSASLQAIKTSIDGLVKMEEGFKGEGAQAIKSFYQDCHQPFLVKLQQVFTLYETKLSEMGKALDAFEPSNTGYIMQSFLHNDLKPAITKAGTYTAEVVAESNEVIAGIQKIASIPSLTTSSVTHNLKQSLQSIENTMEAMEQFDQQQNTSLKELIADLQLLKSYIQDMNTKLVSGKLSVASYSSDQLNDFMNRFLLVSSIRPEGASLEDLLKNKYGTPEGKTEALHSMLGLEEFPIYALNEEDNPYLMGEVNGTAKFQQSAGLGKIENEWNKKGQVGGKSSFSGIHAGIESDTAIIDSKFSQDIITAEGEVSVGGESVFPLINAGGSVYNVDARAQIDKKIPLIARAGGEAGADILTANAYAGVDGGSIGLGAKASIAEGEVSGIIPIPWTPINMKGTIGGSAGSVGGELKVGKEIVVDLRLLLGVKLGVSFEKQE